MTDAESSVDFRAVLATTAGQGPLWTHLSDDLNINLVVWPRGQGVAEHVNAEVDVLLVGVEGEGIVTLNGQPLLLGGGQLIVVPKGSRRSIRATSEKLAYLSCHRRRAGLYPTLPA